MLVARKISGEVEYQAVCTAAENVNDAVYISGPATGDILQVRTVDITDVNKMPGIGLIKSKSTPTACIIKALGPITIPGITPGKRYFINVAGSISPTIPPAGAPAKIIQEMGVAFSQNVLYINPQKIGQII